MTDSSVSHHECLPHLLRQYSLARRARFDVLGFRGADELVDLECVP